MKDKVYQQILEHVIRLLSEHKSVEMIAGCLMVIAQRLYKTHLSPQDYKENYEGCLSSRGSAI